MDENASLDAFTTEPARTTYRWSVRPVDCDRCGEAVRGRWHEDETFVCSSCKEW